MKIVYTFIIWNPQPRDKCPTRRTLNFDSIYVVRMSRCIIERLYNSRELEIIQMLHQLNVRSDTFLSENFFIINIDLKDSFKIKKHADNCYVLACK